MSPSTPTIVVVGAGAENLKSTVAANLAAAFATANVAVALVDHDGASSRALVATDGVATLPWTSRVVRLAPDGTERVVVIDPPPRLGPATTAAIAEAAMVLVPVDATPLALRVLRDVAILVEPTRLRAVLGRLVPREVDRWSLVDQVADVAPDALLRTTLPMARSTRAAAARDRAVLYAPGTAAARAYAALAAELLSTFP